MASAQDPTKPVKPDGTTDWKVAFEDPEKGFIVLITAAQSPEVLRQAATVVIQQLFTRKGDSALVETLTAELDRIVPEGADAAGLDAMCEGVANLLRGIEEERIAKADAYAKREAGEDVADEAESEPEAEGGPEAGEKTEDRRKSARGRRGTTVGRRAVDQERRPAGAMGRLLAPLSRPVVGLSMVTGILIAGLAVAYLAQSGLFDKVPDNPDAAVEWVRAYALKHRPSEKWKIDSLTIKDRVELHLEYLIIDRRHAALIRSKSRMTRLSYLESICPDKKSGVMTLVNQGWRIFVSLKSPKDPLTAGTCRY